MAGTGYPGESRDRHLVSVYPLGSTIGRVVPFVKLKRETQSVSRSSTDNAFAIQLSAPMDDLAHLAELDLNAQRRDR